MSEIPEQTRDHPLARILVWTAILGAATTFWLVVVAAAFTWIRIH